MSTRNELTLRDHFAIAAFPAIQNAYQMGHPDGWLGLARRAYQVADFMLEVRQETQTPEIEGTPV